MAFSFKLHSLYWGTVMSIWELNLHIRLKVWNLVHTFIGPYYLIKSMEALWEIHASAKSNMAPLDTPFGHNSVNAWAILIILVSIIWFSRVGSQSVRYFVTIFKDLTILQQDLIKYKQFSLHINVIRQHLTTTTKDNDIHTICYI